MENVQHCRAMGSLFRQFAAFDPVNSWKYLIEAQKWEHLAEAEIASHFKECNTIQGSRTPPDAVSSGESLGKSSGVEPARNSTPVTIPTATL